MHAATTNMTAVEIHPSAHWAAAGEHEHIARLDPFVFNRGDGRRFAQEDLGWSNLAIDAVIVHHGGIDRGAFYNRSTRSDIAGGKTDGRRKAPLFGGIRR